MNKINYLISMVMLFFLSNMTFSQLQDSEELFYDVNYAFINIGTVKFTNSIIDNSQHKYKANAILKSNDALPFVDVNYEFNIEYIVDGNNIKLLNSVQKEYKGNKSSTQIYTFNYDSSYIRMYKTGFDNEVHFDKTIPLDKQYQDGLSIFYYARLNSKSRKTESIPVLMNEAASSININYSIDNDDIDIDDVDYSIASSVIDGFANFKAVFGLTGEFKGFFSNDNYRIPLRANLEVQIGKVTLELNRWKVKNWIPPKA